MSRVERISPDPNAAARPVPKQPQIFFILIKQKSSYLMGKRTDGSFLSAVQPITRDSEFTFLYQRKAGFLAYKSSHTAVFPLIQ